MSRSVLFVDHDSGILGALSRIFSDDDNLEVRTAQDAASALGILAASPVDLLVSDELPRGGQSIDLFRRVRELYPNLPLMLLTESDPGRALQMGSDLDCHLPVVQKPWDTDELKRTVHESLRLVELTDEERTLVRYGGVRVDRLERARKIHRRLQKPVPLGEILVQLGEMTAGQLAEIDRERRARLSLLELLVEDGSLSEEGRTAYLSAKQQRPELSDRVTLVDSGLITEEQFLRALCTRNQIPFVEPELRLVDDRVIQKTSLRYLQKHSILPIRVFDGRLEVVMADPLDAGLASELERIFGVPIHPSCSTRDRIGEALRTLENLGSSDEALPSALQYREIEKLTDGEDIGKEAVQIVDYLLMRAIELKASDLHIEPMQNKVRVRVRVDGVLQQLTELPVSIAGRLASRIKILAGCDISEKRLHQDGKICVKIDGREIDIRVSSYVTIYGETLVMRLLDRSGNLVSLDKIGFQPRIMSVIEDVLLKTSSGLILLTGPTGSGKTTTLYSFVSYSLDPSEKVITCEDPVEYVIEGVVQCSVNSKTGPTFPDSLRAIVRQDPDTILVGEVRDAITANLAFESALTGHKVYSTFHTEDAATVFVRLLEMGLEPFLVSSALAGIIAQRLMRRVCTHCRVPGQPTAKQLRFLGMDKAEFRDLKLWDAKGCNRCEGTGYKGRLGIHEVLVPDDDLRDAVLNRAAAKDLRRLARNLPEFLTLQEDAVLKVVAGLTTLDEVVDNAPRDTHARPLSVLMGIAGMGRA